MPSLKLQLPVREPSTSPRRPATFAPLQQNNCLTGRYFQRRGHILPAKTVEKAWVTCGEPSLPLIAHRCSFRLRVIMQVPSPAMIISFRQAP
mmetsp:Transcript_31586/g.63107  ORF Transcript_31586/g.63107 Transcript_31586/m.63107 type:complete len:92 (+) Transcript_31586:1064-1339(+)